MANTPVVPEQTRVVAEFVAHTSEAEVPVAAVDLARRAMADTVGVALAGRRDATGRAMLDYVLDQAARPVAGLLGGGRSTPELAGLANGLFAHALEFDDINHPLYGHPSASTVPALLAIGEEIDATVGDALIAYVLGVEVDALLGSQMMMAHSERGFHSTGTIGALGATAAAARLAGLDPGLTQHAFGVAASLAGGLRANFGTMTKPLHAGTAAMAAVQAVRLAQRGWTANPEIFTGEIGFISAHGGTPSGEPLARLGTHWSLLAPAGLAVKPYPSCGATHTAIDAALAVRRLLGAEEIAHVRVGVSPRAPHLLIFDSPETGGEARFSAQYTVAAALVRGAIGLDDFSDAAVSDGAVRALMDRITVVVDERHRASTQYPASVAVHTRGGRVIEKTVELARGKNANPLSEEELEAKFDGCVGPGHTGLWATWRHAPLDMPIAELVAATAPK